MNHSERFTPGTSHLMAKGTLKVKAYTMDGSTLMMTYTLNNSSVEYTNKYVNIISVIYKWQKKNNMTEAPTLREFLEVQLVRPLKFGVEMELVSPISMTPLLIALKEAGVNMVDSCATHSVVSGWKLVRDGSIKTTAANPFGFELVSPPSTDFNELKIACEVLKECGVKTNISTGIHVHHQIKELKRQQIMRVYEFYYKYETLIDSLLPKSRENNSFCKSIGNMIYTLRACNTKTDLMNKVAGKNQASYYNSCRYYKINLRSFIYYGTIEFRQHGGSINFEEISNWILFTHKIIDRATQIGQNIETLETPRTNKKGMLKEMVKELKIENTKLESNLQYRLANRKAS